MADKSITLSNGEKMPAVMLGTFRTRGDFVKPAVTASLMEGYRGIDTAAVYRNHKEIADTLETVLPNLGLKREDIFITSKLSPSDQGTESCKEAIDRCLSELRTSYLDLFLIHWPGVRKLDVNHLDNRKLRLESWNVLEEYYKSGKLKSIGVSNFNIKHLEDLLDNCDIIPHVNQVELHPHYPQEHLAQYCKNKGIHLQAYSSLGQDGPNSDLFKSPTVVKIAQSLNKTIPQVLLKWGLQHGYSVLPKSKNPDHIKDNFKLNFTIPEECMIELDNLHKTETKKYAWDPDSVI